MAESSASERNSADRYRWAIPTVLAAFAILKLVYIFVLPLTGDEALLWEWSRHLDWCYVDHPPLTAWLIRLSTELLGTNTLAVRLPGLLCTLGAMSVLAALSRRLFHSDRAVFWTVVVLACTPIMHAIGLLATVDAALFLFYGLATLALVKALDSEHLKPWFWVGLWTGLAVLSKLLGWLIPLGALVAMAATPRLRPKLRTPGPYLALVIAVAMFSPVLVWNANHEWANLLFTSTLRERNSMGLLSIPYYLLDQGTPVFQLVWLAIIAALIGRAKNGLRNQEVGVAAAWWMAVTPLLVFGIQSFQSRIAPHWPTSALLIGIVLMVPVLLASSKKWVRVYFHVAWAGALGLVALLHLLIAFIDEIATRRDFNKDITTSEMNAVFGWKEIGEAVDRDRREMAKEGPVFLITPNHVFAAQFSFYAPERPAAYRFGKPSLFGRSYEQWQRYADWKGQNAVFFHDKEIKGGRLERLHEAFDRVELEAPIPIRIHGRVVRQWFLARCYGFRRYPWQEYLDDILKH